MLVLALYCDERLCMSVCPLAYLENYTLKLHEIFRAYYLRRVSVSTRHFALVTSPRERRSIVITVCMPVSLLASQKPHVRQNFLYVTCIWPWLSVVL